MPNFQSSAKMGLTKSLYPYTIVFKSEPEAVLKLTRNEIFLFHLMFLIYFHSEHMDFIIMIFEKMLYNKQNWKIICSLDLLHLI